MHLTADRSYLFNKFFFYGKMNIFSFWEAYTSIYFNKHGIEAGNYLFPIRCRDYPAFDKHFYVRYRAFDIVRREPLVERERTDKIIMIFHFSSFFFVYP